MPLALFYFPGPSALSGAKQCWSAGSDTHKVSASLGKDRAGGTSPFIQDLIKRAWNNPHLGGQSTDLRANAAQRMDGNAWAGTPLTIKSRGAAFLPAHRVPDFSAGSAAPTGHLSVFPPSFCNSWCQQGTNTAVAHFLLPEDGGRISKLRWAGWLVFQPMNHQNVQLRTQRVIWNKYNTW